MHSLDYFDNLSLINSFIIPSDKFDKVFPYISKFKQFTLSFLSFAFINNIRVQVNKTGLSLKVEPGSR